MRKLINNRAIYLFIYNLLLLKKFMEVLFGLFPYISPCAYTRGGLIHEEIFLLGKWWAYTRGAYIFEGRGGGYFRGFTVNYQYVSSSNIKFNSSLRQISCD